MDAPQHDALAALARRHFGAGARVERVDTALGGGSNRTTFFDVVEAAGRTPLRLASSPTNEEGPRRSVAGVPFIFLPRARLEARDF